MATAIAAAALEDVGDESDGDAIRAAVGWLDANRNPDGGWGDAPGCPSNLSATLIVHVALARFSSDARSRSAGGAWLDRLAPGLTPDAIASAVLASYGDDRTFSVPILTFAAAMGALGPADEAWRRLPQLPCEAGILPHTALAILRLPVVSYALPALIAMGLARHRRTPASGPRAWLRDALTPALLRRLERLQPDDGGFLEAVPLTGFTAIALAAAGLPDHPVARRAAAFLRSLRRPDGSWPIDRDLAVWLTTGAAFGLAMAADEDLWPHADRRRLREWLLAQQAATPHPFTGAAPGGWAWTDYPGGVPDADDTSSALLALRALGPPDASIASAAADGARWLLDLQNRDGGFPTFCRGWGRLPFDRSSPDITAHAIRALAAWSEAFPPPLWRRYRRALRHAAAFLAGAQSREGAWTPLWFGHSRAPDGANPVLGTGQVLRALAVLGPDSEAAQLRQRAISYLADAQQRSGGWSGAAALEPEVEETAMALAGLAVAGAPTGLIDRGLAWLEAAWSADPPPRPAPIGLYFARLWYAEDLYPLIFSLHAAAAIARWRPASAL